jgi:hypothetical protein
MVELVATEVDSATLVAREEVVAVPVAVEVAEEAAKGEGCIPRYANHCRRHT